MVFTSRTSADIIVDNGYYNLVSLQVATVNSLSAKQLGDARMLVIGRTSHKCAEYY